MEDSVTMLEGRTHFTREFATLSYSDGLAVFVVVVWD